jgi:hypothetical protein
MGKPKGVLSSALNGVSTAEMSSSEIDRLFPDKKPLSRKHEPNYSRTDDRVVVEEAGFDEAKRVIRGHS